MSAVPYNLPSLGGGLAPPAEDLPGIQVEFDGEPDDMPVFDERGAVVRIDHGDGSVTVSMDGKPIAEAHNDVDVGWYGNLADRIDSATLSSLTEDLLLGISEDLESRKEWIEDRAQGMRLLGLRIEMPNVQGASEGAPVEGMSKVRHPLLLEAVLRFQANARSEFLPTDGPVKIRDDSSGSNLETNQLANALEQDLNHYLTAVATEYYPDTDRMLFMAGFGGDGFKKIYTCPLRNRPVSESVDADDLIVNQSATDLGNAQRVTHRSLMKPSTVRRLQILGVYRDVSLGQAVAPDRDALKEEESEQQGIRAESLRNPKDQEREIYECYCEIDIPGFEHKQRGKVTGLPVPYVVTIDKSDRVALSVVRNYPEPAKGELPQAKKRFVKFPFVPGIGFYGIGLLHILGNTTNAITAAWRLMLDNAMFANFPGFVTAKASSRQNTNIFRVPPGGSVQIETGGLAIGDFMKALPYNTAHMPPMLDLVQDIAQTGQRLGGTSETQVGEGRADVPVGTVLALIDQQIKVMNAVHKRMHAAQAEEFQLLRDEFKEHPEALCRCKTKTPWDRARIEAALANCDLVPQADPNTSSSGQRTMKIMGLVQLQSQFQTLLDPVKICTAAITAMGWANAQEFMVPPAAQAAKPPQLVQAEAELQNKTREVGAKELEARAKMVTAEGVAAKAHAEAQAPPEGLAGAQQPQGPDVTDIAKAHAALTDAHTREMEAKIKAADLELRQRSEGTEDRNRDADRRDKLLDSKIDLAKDLITAPPGAQNVGTKANRIVDTLGKPNE